MFVSFSILSLISSLSYVFGLSHHVLERDFLTAWLKNICKYVLEFVDTNWLLDELIILTE